MEGNGKYSAQDREREDLEAIEVGVFVCELAKWKESWS